MHVKLVEEWLTKAGERGGFDQAFAQLLTSQGHEVLWQGHSRIEFGKDIVTVDSEGLFHAYQIKDEDLTLSEIRKHDSQVTDLVEVPIQHPRVPPGTSHIPHLITSGLAKEEANLKILAKNQAWKTRGYRELEIVDRASLVPRFVQMADSFWPDRPKNIRDFFSFYLAEGKGDFDPHRFSTLLVELLPDQVASKSRAERVASALCIIGNYMLSAFEREKDHWSLFRGWVIIAAHVAWYAQARQLPDKHWRHAFTLARQSAVEQLKALLIEATGKDALAPNGFEMDDLTRSRNTVVAGAISAWCLINRSMSVEGVDIKPIMHLLVKQARLLIWGESALPMVLCLLWVTEQHCPEIDVIPIIKEYVSEACERNTAHSDDEPIEPPQTDPDAILERLFVFKQPRNRPRKAKHLWAMQAVIHLLARRGEREFLTDRWPLISKLDLMAFRADVVDDLLLWHKVAGKEEHRKPRKTQSWSLLCQEAQTSMHSDIPSVFSLDQDFALLYFLAYPHRISTALVSHIDSIFRKETAVPSA
jgi:hypothetical protein